MPFGVTRKAEKEHTAAEKKKQTVTWNPSANPPQRFMFRCQSRELTWAASCSEFTDQQRDPLIERFSISQYRLSWKKDLKMRRTWSPKHTTSPGVDQ